MKHACRKGGRQAGVFDGAAWCVPGEIVKLADEERWGRIALRHRCCDSYTVTLPEFGDDEAEVRDAQPESAFENAWDAYPVNLPPRGYPIPKSWPRTGNTAFGTGVTPSRGGDRA